MTRYFVSDPHFSQKNIVNYERKQFDTIEEHDEFMYNLFHSWAKKLKKEDELWVLGDWGFFNSKTELRKSLQRAMLPFIWKGIQTHFVYGNHDKQEDKFKFEAWFDEVHEYPVWLSQKLVVSHFPVAVYKDSINIHGHLHNSYLKDSNHICASVHVNDYKLISEQQIAGQFGQLPKFNRRFLWEPWIEDTVIIKPNRTRKDLILNKDGLIDVSASRVYQRLQQKKRADDESR